LFQRQIEMGGPVTVTDPEASRYFMTIPEACSLVLKTGGVGDGGESYLLDMGEPVKIKDLAEQLIRFYGFEPERDIPIRFIGLRAGERRDETLHSRQESLTPTSFPRVKRLILSPDAELPVEDVLSELRPVCVLETGHEPEYRNRLRLREILRRYIPTLEAPEHEPEY
jgi:FlaA1/EpsC-like NDP-sugar epimerase